MNTLMILCATVISAVSAQDCQPTTPLAKPVPVQTLEFKGDITLMQGYERFLADPQMFVRPERDT